MESTGDYVEGWLYRVQRIRYLLGPVVSVGPSDDRLGLTVVDLAPIGING